MSKERELLKQVCDVLANAKLNRLEDIEILNLIYKELETPEKTHIVWIPNTGVKPDCKMVLIKDDCGVLAVRSPGIYNWSLSRKYPIKEYAIIEE